MLWPPDAKNWLIGKDPDAGKDWRQKEKRVTEDEMVGWHHQINKHDLGQTLGNGEGQRSLVCCSPWGYRVRHNFQQHDLIGLTRVANIVFYSHFYPFTDDVSETVFKFCRRKWHDQLVICTKHRMECCCSVILLSDSLPPKDCRVPGSPVFHHLQDLAQTHLH